MNEECRGSLSITFWQVVQSGVLCSDLSKAITERERSEDRDHHDVAVQDAVPRFE